MYLMSSQPRISISFSLIKLFYVNVWIEKTHDGVVELIETPILIEYGIYLFNSMIYRSISEIGFI